MAYPVPHHPFATRECRLRRQGSLCPAQLPHCPKHSVNCVHGQRGQLRKRRCRALASQHSRGARGRRRTWLFSNGDHPRQELSKRSSGGQEPVHGILLQRLRGSVMAVEPTRCLPRGSCEAFEGAAPTSTSLNVKCRQALTRGRIL